MKYAKLIALLWCIFLSVETFTYGQAKKKSDAEQRELFGAVHEVRLSRKTIMTLNEDKEFGDGWIPSFSVFNKYGGLERFEAFDDKGIYEYEIVSQFNSSGQKIEEIQTRANGERLLKRTFAYDKDGNQIEMKEYFGDEDKLGSSYHWTFDDKGFEASSVGMSSDGKIFSIGRKTRDDSGESTSYYNAAGEIIERSLETANKSGKNQNQESIQMDVNGNVLTRNVTITDEKGDVTEIEYDREGKILEKRVYAYERDSRGNWTKEVESDWLNTDNQLTLRKKQEAIRIIKYY